MTKERVGRIGGPAPFAAIMEHPLLFATLSVLVFAVSLILVLQLVDPLKVEARVRAELVEVDQEADDPALLLRPASIDPRELKTRLLSGSETDPEALPDADPDPALISKVEFVQGPDDDQIIVRLTTNDVPNGKTAVGHAASALVDHLNQQRLEQKDMAAGWVVRMIAAWHDRIDKAKAAIIQSEFQGDLSRDPDNAESDTLLRLMVDAVGEAHPEVFPPKPPVSDPLADAPDAVLSDDTELPLDQPPLSNPAAHDLPPDVEQLANVLSAIQRDRAVQIEQAAEQKRAQDGLADFQKRSKELLGDDGVLGRVAAELIAPPAVIASRLSLLTNDWRLALPLCAGLSLITACLVVMVAAAFKRREGPRSDDYLNDPHWPLPEYAPRDV